MMDAAMDFKAALLKCQPGAAAAASVFKPTAGDASTANGKAQDARPADSFHASGDEGRGNAVKRMRNRPSKRRHLDSSALPPKAMFDFNMLPTIIETGPTPPMKSESPCVESWAYVSPHGRPPLTALQGIALRARDRLASRIHAEFARQTNSAIALDRVREHVFAQLQCQLDVVTAPTPEAQSTVVGSDTPLSSTDPNNGLNIQLKGMQAEDEEIAHLKEALEKEKEAHAKTKQDLTAMSGGLVQLRNDLGVYQKRIVVLEKEKEEIALKLQEQEATIQAFGKPRIPLSRSSSSSSSCADSDHVLSSSGVSSVSPTSSERELAFSTFSTLVRRRGTASPGASLAPPPVALAHRRGLSLQHTPSKAGLGARPLSNASNVVSSEYGYLSFTLPNKGADGKMVDAPPPTGPSDLTARL